MSDRSSSPPTEPEPEAATAPPIRNYHPFSLPVLALLIPGSIFGLLARLGIQSITNYDGNSVFPLAWVQGMGCLVMGIAIGLRDPLSKFYPPLYTAITTGFCGSLTTFSTWQIDIFLAWTGTGFQRDWFRDVIDGLTQFLVTLAVALGALALGLHLAEHAIRYLPSKPSPPNRFIRYFLTVLSIISYALCITFYFILSADYRHQATAAMLFAFPGALSRHTLSILSNPRTPSYPMGTFSANMLATTLYATFNVLQRASSVSPNGCAILQGCMDGYCGCLSTVSTFAVEVRGLKAKAWAYVGGSYITAQVLVVLVLGSAWWSGAIQEASRCAFR